LASVEAFEPTSASAAVAAALIRPAENAAESASAWLALVAETVIAL
jgi:hypothetical protein